MLTLKRAFDVVVSAAALTLASPLLALIALAIKIEHPRLPLFFNDTVMGKDAARFRMFKFRTMIPHAIDYQTRPEVTSGNRLRHAHAAPCCGASSSTSCRNCGTCCAAT